MAHLVDLSCPPPAFLRAAAEAGYNAVSLRTLGHPEDHPWDLAHDPRLLAETQRALEETGITWTDAEVVRVTEELDAQAWEPALAVAAELGVRQITANIQSAEAERCLEPFQALSRLAEKYGQTINVEFVSWAGVSDLRQAKEFLIAAGRPNVGILVDMLHFYRSRVSLIELDNCPQDWFHYIHLCDCPKEIPGSVCQLRRDGLTRRLCPGEGAIPIREILSHIPGQIPVYVLEIPNRERLERIGLGLYARWLLEKTKAYLTMSDRT